MSEAPPEIQLYVEANPDAPGLIVVDQDGRRLAGLKSWGLEGDAATVGALILRVRIEPSETMQAALLALLGGGASL